MTHCGTHTDYIQFITFLHLKRLEVSLQWVIINSFNRFSFLIPSFVVFSSWRRKKLSEMEFHLVVFSKLHKREYNCIKELTKNNPKRHSLIKTLTR